MSSEKALSYSARTPEDYIRTRVDFKTESYRAKGERYRWGYLAMACTSAVAAAMVPVLINLGSIEKKYPTILSLLVTILVGLEGILHFREHWKNYDLMKSFLRQEACLFQAKAGAYKSKKDSAAFVLLVERVEEAISKERTQTIQMRTARTSEPDQQKRQAHEAVAQGRDEGRSEEAARNLLTVLGVRGITVPDTARERILAQKDPERLELWLAKAIVAGSVGEVIDEPS